MKTFLQLLFQSLIKGLKPIADTLLDILNILLNTIKYNGVYIAISIAFPLLLLYLGVTKDFIISLNEKENYNNIIYISIYFFFLAVTIWIIPAFSISLFLRAMKKQRYSLYFYSAFESVYNGKKTKNKDRQIAAKYLAILPWCIYTFSIIYCFRREGETFLISLLIVYQLLVLIGSFFLIQFNRRKFSKVLVNEKEILTTVVIVLLSPLIYNWLLTSNMEEFLFYLLMYNTLGIMLTFMFFVFLEKKISKTSIQFKFSYRFQLFIIIICILSLTSFTILAYNGQLGKVSPIVILLLIAISLILLFENLYTVPHTIKYIIESRKFLQTHYGFKGKYVFLRLLFYISFPLILIYTFRFSGEKKINSDVSSYSSFKMERKEIIDSRHTIDTYFEKWIAQHQTKESDTLNLILVSGEGGGSTAGSWLLTNMLMLEKVYPQLYSHIFSFSTVSGSSTGANFYLGIKANNLYDQTRMNPGYLTEIVGKLYTKNYFSSNLFGLLFTDPFLYPLTLKDRNYILQQEEMRALRDAFSNDSLLSKNRKNDIENYFNQDYLSLWRKNSSAINPLLFLNTTRVDDGTKALISPIQLNTGFTRAVDVNKDFFSAHYQTAKNTGHLKKPFIQLGAAVVQSEAFPLLCTYNSYGDGHLGDGGMYENTGTDTTLYIYKQLKIILRSEKYKHLKVRIIFLNFINQGKPEKESRQKNKTEIEYTLQQVINNPFSGHSKDAEFNLQNAMKNYNKGAQIRDTAFQFGNSGEFVTTRLISKKSIIKMLSYAHGKNYTKLHKLLVKNKILLYYGTKEDEKKIDSLKKTLTKKGFGVEMSYIPNFDINQVRFFKSTDNSNANSIRNIINKNFNKEVLDVKYFDFSKINSSVKKNEIEVWIN